jgi:hypothetical protein
MDVRSSHRTGTLKDVATEVTKCNLDLVAALDVKWVDGDNQPTYRLRFCIETEMLTDN